jgi:choline dehydrogenase-like flavoprotein
MVLMVRAVRLARAIAEDPALAPFRVEELYPGPSATSDGEIEAFIRESTTTVSHSCGTCAMGSDGVLDGELRLRNIDRLRVVDASAMPTIITGHTNACVIMMAERASDFIRSKGY